MNKYIRFVPLVLLLSYVLFKAAPYIQNKTPGDPEHEPTASQKEMLADVKAIISSHPEAAKDFTNLYYGIALVVGSDEVVLNTTDEVRRVHENAGAIAIQAGEIPRIPGYADAVNKYLSQEIGTDNVPLDLKTKKKIIDAFKGLAWATSQ